MRGEIIAIGDELIRGRVRETNAGYAASRLWALGIDIGAVVVVGDQPRAMADALSRAVKRSDFVVVTGGLGATEDDVTAAVAAEVFGLPMAESERMVKNLRAFFEARGRSLSDEARRMAQLPEGAEVLGKHSAGFKLTTREGRPVFFLPGVPAEARLLMDETVAPELATLAGQLHPPVSGELRIFGVPESKVGVRLKDLGGNPENVTVGFYPVFPEVQVVITARDMPEEKARALVDELVAEAAGRLAPNVVATGGERLEEVVGRKMVKRGLTLAVAESCTGGLIGNRITNVSGSSEFFERGVVVYSNRAKEELLGVAPAILEEFGAVSSQTAGEMALGLAARAGVDIALSVTGIAGPTGGTPEKPVGTVHFGLAQGGSARTEHQVFSGNRRMIKAQAAENALFLLLRRLREL